ncbi:MAG: hypothetical protein L0Z53_19920 [Acidobacteriales bacterium]|nr:hypothetical protein [Terriglobales bacterium]
MIRRAFYVITAVVLLTVMSAAQGKPEYLDAFIVKVKPDKRGDFDTATKKAVEANRANNGDRWIATETLYGEGNTISFISTREGFAGIEKGMQAFEQSLMKGLGAAGMQKMFQDFAASTIGSRAEIRVRRWDLSAAAPGDAAGRAKIVGEARFLRTTIVHVKPGHQVEFEELAKTVKAALEKANPPQTTFVSQSIAGPGGAIYYITSLQKSLADFDNVLPLPQLLGPEGFRSFQSAVAQHVEHAEVVINRFLPELSNAPDEVASMAPDFWRPKAAAAPAKKPATKPQ